MKAKFTARSDVAKVEVNLEIFQHMKFNFHPRHVQFKWMWQRFENHCREYSKANSWVSTDE